MNDNACLLYVVARSGRAMDLVCDGKNALDYARELFDAGFTYIDVSVARGWRGRTDVRSHFVWESRYHG